MITASISEKSSLVRIAIDTGGTFTDCVYLDQTGLRVLKVFSTPSNPSHAVLDVLEKIGAAGRLDVRHGTTVGTNTMLERTGARVAFVTTAGFEDTIAIGRQTRSKLYDWFVSAPECLVPSELRFGVPERVSAEGAILRSPSRQELEALRERIAVSGAEAIAISLLFSFANPENERRVEAFLTSLGLPISTSHRILPEFREYERASTVVVNAYLSPKVQTYLLDLERRVVEEHAGSAVNVMQSSGGIISARLGAQEPVRTVLSGPAGGVIGAYQLARQAGFQRVIGFDMGGTSTDVFLADAESGGPRVTSESVVAGVPVGVPMLDIHTAGAGGGSIARFDAGGLLRVGPESAGADPGPICFGRGRRPTVTDANLLLGRLDEQRFMGGVVTLDRERTRSLMCTEKGPLATVEDFATGILRVVETQMEREIRLISIERGHDPRRFTLVAFGGGGPLHACTLAQTLRIPRVLVPPLPGALSAVGILFADAIRDYSRTVMLPSAADDRIEQEFRALEQVGFSEFAAEGRQGIAQRTLDLRYRGQGYELNVPYGPQLVENFHGLHRRRYGFADENRPVEIVNLRLRVLAAAEPFKPAERPFVPGDGSHALLGERQVWFSGRSSNTGIYDRDLLGPGDTIQGPAIISEYSSATVVPPECRVQVDRFENLVIEVST